MVGLSTRNPATQAVALSVPAEDAGHPVHSIRSTCVTIGGQDTTIVAQAFSDRIFIIVTQIDKLGTMVT